MDTATMEEKTSPTPPASSRNPAEELLESLGQQRGRVDEFLAAQRKRLAAAEATLGTQLDRISQELSRADQEHRRTEDDLAARSRQLDEEAQSVARLKEELHAAQAEWRSAQDRAIKQQSDLAEQIQRQQNDLVAQIEQLAHRRAEMAEVEAALAHDRQALALAQKEREEETQRLAKRRESLEAEIARLQEQREELASLRSKTEGQRRRIAREFEAQRTAQRKELDRRQADIERLADDRLADLKRQLDDAVAHRDALQAGLEATQRQVGEAGRAGDEAAAAQVAQLRIELAGLQAERSRLEKALADAPTQRGSGGSDAEDFRRRYEMAMDDLRDLKKQNAQLQEQLSRRAPSAAPSPTGGLDWEAQKRRILEALEADAANEDEESREERIRIEDVIATTQRIIDEKDREIAELKTLLESQSGRVGDMAVGVGAFAEILDQDQFIQEERASLKQLQDELREKLRKAEVEISIERAKLARDKAELDERLREVGPRQPAPTKEPESPTGRESRSRGRWFSQLGLGGADEPEKGDA